ncbi:MAG: hypothetical protein PVG51_10325 [Desulfosarcina sp.]
MTSLVIFASVILRFHLLLFPFTGALVVMTIIEHLLNDPAADQPHDAAVAEIESVAPYAKEE